MLMTKPPRQTFKFNLSQISNELLDLFYQVEPEMAKQLGFALSSVIESTMTLHSISLRKENGMLFFATEMLKLSINLQGALTNVQLLLPQKNEDAR